MNIFGGARRRVGALGALVIAASSLMVVGAAPSAAAGEVVPCTETVGPGGYVRDRPGGYDRVRSAVLTIQLASYDVESGQRELTLRTGSPTTGDDRVAIISGFATDGTYVFGACTDALSRTVKLRRR